MRKVFKSKNILRVLLVFLAILIILSPSESNLQVNPQDVYDFPPMDPGPKEGHPKMESVLYQLMVIYTNKGLEEAKAFAKQRLIDLDGDFVRVVLETKIKGIDKEMIRIAAKTLEYEVLNLGGRVETTYQQLIQSQIPMSTLLYFADSSSTKYIRLPHKPILDEQSEGVTKVGANNWHGIPPYRSEGAKVCILDFGFKGYEALLGTELPSDVIVKSFRSDNDIEAGDVHGTGCAEIVHDMAPNAKLWLVNFGTGVEAANAVNWIINQGVEIISHSVGYFNMGPGDGTGPACEVVKKAHDAGITWVQSAGNYALKHWGAEFNDSDNDGWHDFSGSNQILRIRSWPVGKLRILLKWNDWGIWNGMEFSGSNQDFDLYLYVWWGDEWVYVRNSFNPQTGSQLPTEYIELTFSTAEETLIWGIKIKKVNSNKKVKFDLIIPDPVSFEYFVPSGSLGSPADSPYAITVGAVHWENDVLESYSSQGPTTDGRIKPDLCAPSVVSTVSYLNLGKLFNGTSAACPHVVGAFALLKGKTPQNLVDIKATLEALAIDLGSVGKDNKFGIGRLNLIR